jgi:naphthoate synthase
MQDDSRRRIATIAGHLQPLESPVNEIPQPGNTQVSAAQHTAAKQEAAIKSSYAKVHGEVSEEPASWTGIPAVQKTALQEVIYQKAVREGIAKVSIYDPLFCLLLGSKRC